MSTCQLQDKYRAKDSDINVKTLNIEEAKSPAISGLLKQLIVKPVVIEPQVKEGKKDNSA